MEMFQKYNAHMEEENEIREKIREVVKWVIKFDQNILPEISWPLVFRLIDTESKEATAALQVIHTSLSELGKACLDARACFEKCNKHYQELKAIVPAGQYYRFNDHWNWTTQRLVSLIALVIYLEAGFLVTRDTCAEILGVENQQSKGFHLDLETYLMGILQMVSELSRFAINSVTLGDYSRVLMLQRFVGDINSGFRLLNLKNDALRKRFDTLKYDVKKIEEIVYDLSIRGLLKAAEDTPAESASVAMKED